MKLRCWHESVLRVNHIIETSWEATEKPGKGTKLMEKVCNRVRKYFRFERMFVKSKRFREIMQFEKESAWG